MKRAIGLVKISIFLLAFNNLAMANLKALDCSANYLSLEGYSIIFYPYEKNSKSYVNITIGKDGASRVFFAMIELNDRSIKELSVRGQLFEGFSFHQESYNSNTYFNVSYEDRYFFKLKIDAENRGEVMYSDLQGARPKLVRLPAE